MRALDAADLARDAETDREHSDGRTSMRLL